MKNLYVITILFYCCICSHAQTANWEWAKSAGGNVPLQTSGISTDAFGNVYTTGGFFNLVVNSGAFYSFGADTIKNTGVFVSKYDSSGDLIWLKTATGALHAGGGGISADIKGDVYVTGFFFDTTITFGGITLTHTSDVGSVNFFIVKYDSAGTVMWAKGAGGFESEGTGISADAEGNVYVTGFFYGATVSFDGTVLNNPGLYDVFTVKYDASGNVVWANSAVDNYIAEGFSITADNAGSVYVTGSYQGSLLGFGNLSLFSSGPENLFVVKYDTSGNLVWAKNANGSNCSSTAVSGDMQGNIYVTGGYRDTLIFNSDSLITSGGNNAFLLKYDSAGNEIWAKTTGGPNANYATWLSNDTSGNIYVTGYFNGTAAFGNNTLTSAGEADIFVAKYNTAGNVIWAKSAGSDSSDVGTAISVNPQGDVYLSGLFQSPEITFGPSTLTNSSGNESNFFVAKLEQSPETGIINPKNDYDAINVFPNPSTSTFNFSGVTPGATIQVYNVLGEIIYTSVADNTNYRVTLNSQAKGIYFYRVSDNGNFVGEGKMVLE